MKGVRFLVVAVILVFAFRPELTRYRGERRLAYLEAVRQVLRERSAAVHSNDPRVASLLAAADAVTTYPGDWRPLLISAALRSAAGDRRGAAGRFAAAMRLGERPELDVNLASFHGQQAVADALRVRALWLSPALATYVPESSRERVQRNVRQLHDRLRAGTLSEEDFPPLAIRQGIRSE